MKIERRQPTRRELAGITSRRPVVRRIPAPGDSSGPNGPGRRSTGGQPDRSRAEK